MKKAILTALLCSVVSMPALAGMDHKDKKHHMDHADKMAMYMMKKMDQNNDGIVSMKEHESFNARMFFEADRNDDRMLSREEMERFAMMKKDHKKKDYKGHKKDKWKSGTDRYRGEYNR